MIFFGLQCPILVSNKVSKTFIWKKKIVGEGTLMERGEGGGVGLTLIDKIGHFLTNRE